jgi:hypothetical protein
MKKALMPLLLIAVGILLLASVAYWYENKYSSQGPFPPRYGH